MRCASRGFWRPLNEPKVPILKRVLISVAARYCSDWQADAEEVDDEADDCEFEVETRHAHARKRQDDVLHEEVNDGTPDGRGEDEATVQEGEDAGQCEGDGRR